MRHKKSNRPRTNLFLDIGLTVAFVISMKPFLTGLAVHEWLGLAVGIALAIHALLHWQWIVGITRKFSSRLPRKTRVYYAMDAMLIIAFGMIIVSGVMMSRVVLPAFGLPHLSSEVVAVVHNLSSMVTLALVGVKLVLHRSWIQYAFRRYILGTPKIKLQSKPGVVGAQPLTSVPIYAESAMTAERMSRRRFIILGGSVVAVAVLANKLGQGSELSDREGAEASVVEIDMPAMGFQSSETEISAVSPSVTGGHTPVSSGTEAVVTPTPESAQEGAGVSENATVPGSTRVPRGDVTSQKRCPRGLTNDPYPGRCRLYVDANGNGYCDLSQVS